MGWKVSFKDEREKFVGDNGDYVAEILSVDLVSSVEGQSRRMTENFEDVKIDRISKSGNPYFEWMFLTEQGYISKVTTLIKGKRWPTREVLVACGVKENPNDPEAIFEFEPEDVIKKTVVIRIENNDKNTFTNNEGELVTNTKAEVKQVKPYKIETEQELQEPQEPPKREKLSEKLKEKLPKTKTEPEPEIPF